MTSAAGAAVVTISVAGALTACGGASHGVVAQNTYPTDVSVAAGALGPSSTDSTVTEADNDKPGKPLGPARQRLADAIAANITTKAPIALSASEAQCWAEQIVVDVGTRRLKKMGITAKSIEGLTDLSALKLAPADASALATPLSGCTDVKSLAYEQISAGVGAEVANCVLDNVDPASVEALISATAVNQVASNDVLARFAEAGQSCLTD